MMKDGIVLIDKPKGWTSFDVVAKIRGKLRIESQMKIEVTGQLLNKNSKLMPPKPKIKVGHTGTLDPLATGLLIIVVGKYTKRSQEFTKLDKTYQAELILGSTSTTDDDEGKKYKKSDLIPSENEIELALNKFLGELNQIPPAFSAIKIDGKRAYKLARDGKVVEIKPRKVTIYQISNIEYSYPKLRFAVLVSSGTYIRSLARDLGEELGTGAYLSELRRITVGSFDVTNAIEVDKFTTDRIVEA